MSTFLIFERLDDETQARELAGQLREGGVNARVEQNPELLDQVLIGTSHHSKWLVKIPGSSFDQAYELLDNNINIDMATTDRTYMLFSLTNEELLDVLKKRDEWGAYNYKLARLILDEKGAQPAEAEIDTMQQEFIGELEKPRKMSSIIIFAGYGLSVAAIICGVSGADYLVFSLIYGFYGFPGILSLIVGLLLFFTKKTLPDGRQVLSYDSNSRSHGFLMTILCLFSIALNILLLV